ncbi:hypothetical protein AWB64_06017 [Caballeronia sordidicola]|uniref:Uncharacterized protein n=1 Tax=Caballeronia sordidicola TaxID=196367 RepID=A0A158IER9_CABSO|nr:hypothetical protein AWB64_06017 [Caballeronia sordidicola]
MRLTARPATKSRRRSLARGLSLSNRFYRPVVVAVIAVRMMQVTVDKIVHMIAVRHGVVSATRAMHVPGLMATALVIGRAAIEIGGVDFQLVFIDMVAVRVMQVAVVQVVDMALMANRRVAAAGTMLVIVMGVVRFVAGAHGAFLHQDEAGWVGSAACARTLSSSVRTWSSERA